MPILLAGTRPATIWLIAAVSLMKHTVRVSATNAVQMSQPGEVSQCNRRLDSVVVKILATKDRTTAQRVGGVKLLLGEAQERFELDFPFIISFY